MCKYKSIVPQASCKPATSVPPQDPSFQEIYGREPTFIEQARMDFLAMKYERWLAVSDYFLAGFFAMCFLLNFAVMSAHT